MTIVFSLFKWAAKLQTFFELTNYLDNKIVFIDRNESVRLLFVCNIEFYVDL